MKKKTLIAALVLSLILTACGGNAASSAQESPAEAAESSAEEKQEEETAAETTEESAEEEEMPAGDTTPVVADTIAGAGIDAFLTLGDYQGKELTKYVTFVTDEDVNNRVSSDLDVFTVEMPDDTVIEDGMWADIGYVGTVDGVEFEGGSSESYDLLIGSHTFVDTFEEQLIGAKKGDKVEVVVNFPENYAEELAGKEAHFAVTINAVKESITEPNDEWVAANTEYNTVEEYYEGIRRELQENFDYESDTELRTQVWEELNSSATFYQYPQELVDKYTEMVKEQYEYMAMAYYNASLDTFMQENGITEDYFIEESKNYVKRELIADYILLKEGETLDTPKIEEMANQLLAVNDLSSREEANAWGISNTQIDYAAISNVAIKLVIDKANVTVVDKAEQETEEEEGLKGAYEESGTP